MKSGLRQFGSDSLALRVQRMDKNKFTFEWHSLLKDFINNIWIVVLAALIGLMGIYIASHSVYSPEYTATSTLVVNAKSNTTSSLSNFSISEEMAGVFSRIFVDPTMENAAAEHLGIDYFNGDITAEVLKDTNFLEVKVTSDSPQTSYELLSAVLQVYPELSKNIDNVDITVLKLPSLPKLPSNTISSGNKSMVISACVVIAAFGIIVLSLLRDTVKTEEIFETKVDAKLLGSIPHENKQLTVKERIHKKKKGLLINSNAFISLRFAESFHKIAAKMEHAKHRDGSKVFSVTSIAENEGKSTVASNIALSLAGRGHRVILMDLDGKKPAIYKIFGKKYKENSELGNLFNGEIKPTDFRLRKYKKTSLYLALNTRYYDDSYKWIDNGAIKTIISSLKEKADYIVIDTAPISEDATVTDIVKMVDETVLVVRTDVASVSAVNDTIVTINEVGGKFMGCVLNDVYPDFNLFGMTGTDVAGSYYGRYGKYGKYGKYGSYGKYGNYGKYSKFSQSAYDEPEQTEYEED